MNEIEHFQPRGPNERAVLERNRYREALERILPLVTDLSERGWIKGAEAVEIVKGALSGNR